MTHKLAAGSLLWMESNKNAYLHILYRAQAFTSLMADLCQDINRVSFHLAGALMEHFHEGIAPCKDIGTLTQKEKNTYLLF